jgi:hypothetical protein
MAVIPWASPGLILNEWFWPGFEYLANCIGMKHFEMIADKMVNGGKGTRDFHVCCCSFLKCGQFDVKFSYYHHAIQRRI